MAGRVNIEDSFTVEENANATLCAASVEGVLAQYGCMIISVPFIAPDGRIGAETHIIPKKGAA